MTEQGKAPERCPLCGGQVRPGETTFTVELGFGVVVVRHVPALVCETCGESWIEDETAANLERIVETARSEKSQVEVLAYSA
ncbi:MAG: type II toxin-antitoxin system MqsA family antitoxin [Candidatus Brocadiia bacterium]